MKPFTHITDLHFTRHLPSPTIVYHMLETATDGAPYRWGRVNSYTTRVMHHAGIEWDQHLVEPVTAETRPLTTPATGEDVWATTTLFLRKAEDNPDRLRHEPGDMLAQYLDGAVDLRGVSHPIRYPDQYTTLEQQFLPDLHTAALITGRGTVTDQDRLEALQQSGVGGGHALGCGLLTVSAHKRRL